MSKIVYLLGAGASFGKRAKDDKLSISVPKKSTHIPFGEIVGTCANIIEGLPLVSEIPGRLAYVINKIKSFDNPDRINPQLLKKLNFTGDIAEFISAVKLLIDDFTWLKEECENHATIDTFAKKLFLKGHLAEFYKVESLLSVFFIIEQVINKKDGRYDTFLASVLDSRLNIDDRITILTWNYDSQFELAYKEYGEEKEASGIRRKLGIADLKDQSYETRNQIFKLNGTANFLEQIDLTQYNMLDESLLVKLLDLYLKGREKKGASRISFAWDNNEYIAKNFEDALDASIRNAEVLVVIGYTFPFFNRKLDRRIFDAMYKLKKIYIQDPNAESLVTNLEAIYSTKQDVNKLRNNVIPITNINQFYLPPEL